MKNSNVVFLILICLSVFIQSCNSKSKRTDAENKPEEIFILSEFISKNDSIRHAAENEGYAVPDYSISPYGNYTMGDIHFVILDENHSYYLLNYKNPFPEIDYQLTKEDSILINQLNIKRLEALTPVSTDSIAEIIAKNSGELKENQPISFALKNDTLKGTAISDAIELMKTKNLNIYFFRKINDEEEKQILKLQNHSGN